MAGQVLALLNNASATGASVKVDGGKYLWVEDGTQGGATITLEFLDPVSGAWVAVAGTASTDDAAALVELAEGNYRAAVAGGTPSALYAALHEIA